MDLRYCVVMLILCMMTFTTHTVFADNQIPWKVTIERNSTYTNGTGFLPKEIQAMVGDTIMWTNNDTTAHTITSGLVNHLNYSGKVFDSGILNPHQAYSFKIPPGPWTAYYYFCKIHPWMTGKIDVGTAYLGKSSVLTIKTDKVSYSTGEPMTISGSLIDTSQIMPVVLEIFDSERNMLYTTKVSLAPDHTFRYEISDTGTVFKNTGDYKIKSLYGFPATVTDANIHYTAKDNSATATTVNVPTIPSWIKYDAKWWSQGQISDDDFVKGIQFLISSGDLKGGFTNGMAPQSDEIPSWVKSESGWWASGTISDTEFTSSLQYLINQGVLKA